MSSRAPVPRGAAGQQLDSLRRGNASAVLSELRASGSLSRSDIASNVGLSPAAITKIIGALEHAGYIVEAAESKELGRRGPGRPRQPITLDRDRYRFVGVHVGMHRVTAGLVDMSGQVVALRSRKHPAAAPGVVLSSATRLVRELIERSGMRHDDVLGYGACTGGWVSPEFGTVRVFEGLGWRDVAFSAGLRVNGLPTPRVESTVRSLALAEARLAEGEGARNVLYVFVGNVIGCGHVVNGRVTRGHHDAAGLIDHVSSGARATIACTCGRRDCLWAVASDAALALAAQARGLLADGATIEDLVMAARGTGSVARAARRMLDARAARVGIAVATLIDIHDPGIVIIGGGDLAASAEHFELLVSAAHDHVGSGREPAAIRAATLVGPPSLVQGAATPALDAFFADPLARLRGVSV